LRISISISIPLLFDNACAISIFYDLIKHELTKHIDVYYTQEHFNGVAAF
jgi:hypothetical protein